jgi:hypothetical protein
MPPKDARVQSTAQALKPAQALSVQHVTSKNGSDVCSNSQSTLLEVMGKPSQHQLQHSIGVYHGTMLAHQSARMTGLLDWKSRGTIVVFVVARTAPWPPRSS